MVQVRSNQGARWRNRMFPSSNGLPTPLGTLDQILDAGDSSEKPQKVFIGHNLGNRTFLLSLAMRDFFDMSEVANDRGRDGDTVSQRRLDPAHAHKLAVYLLKGLVSATIRRRQILDKPIPDVLREVEERLGKQPYMAIQPVVVNIRNCDPQGTDIRGFRLEDKRTDETAAFKIFLTQRHVLWVVDGQHRRMGMKLVFEFLDAVRAGRAYPKKGSLLAAAWDGTSISPEELAVWDECFEVARSYCTLLVEVHLGLNPDEERQLFHDLNRLGKKVDPSLALRFDNSNPINQFIKEELVDGLGIGITEEDNVKDLRSDDGRMLRKDLVSVNAVLLMNKGNITGATRAMLEGKQDIAIRFWRTIQQIPGFGEEQAKMKTVAAQSAMLKALAKLVFDFSFSARRPSNGEEVTENLLSRMLDIDFSHDNPMWRYYELSEEDRRKHGLDGLRAYLPAEALANKDIGSFQGNFMRFSAKHNDIVPVLGDMIRWRLDLPPRRATERRGAEQDALPLAAA